MVPAGGRDGPVSRAGWAGDAAQAGEDVRADRAHRLRAGERQAVGDQRRHLPASQAGVLRVEKYGRGRSETYPYRIVTRGAAKLIRGRFQPRLYSARA